MSIYLKLYNGGRKIYDNYKKSHDFLKSTSLLIQKSCCWLLKNAKGLGSTIFPPLRGLPTPPLAALRGHMPFLSDSTRSYFISHNWWGIWLSGDWLRAGATSAAIMISNSDQNWMSILHNRTVQEHLKDQCWRTFCVLSLGAKVNNNRCRDSNVYIDYRGRDYRNVCMFWVVLPPIGELMRHYGSLYIFLGQQGSHICSPW